MLSKSGLFAKTPEALGCFYLLERFCVRIWIYGLGEAIPSCGMIPCRIQWIWNACIGSQSRFLVECGAHLIRIHAFYRIFILCSRLRINCIYPVICRRHFCKILWQSSIYGIVTFNCILYILQRADFFFIIPVQPLSARRTEHNKPKNN